MAIARKFLILWAFGAFIAGFLIVHFSHHLLFVLEHFFA